MVSRVKNCYFAVREGSDETLFCFGADGRAVVDLNGYAIIPIEQYNRLLELAEAQAAGLARALLRRAAKG